MHEENLYLTDYKIWCFHGIAKFLNVQYWKENSIDNRKFVRASFDLKFNPSNHFKDEFNNHSIKYPKPYKLNEMIEYAEILSKEFPFARIDFYEVEKKIYFGEITLTPSAGNNYYLTDYFQTEFGRLIDISNFIRR